jgi:DNA-binding beta-propeller fold protein YncE
MKMRTAGLWGGVLLASWLAAGCETPSTARPAPPAGLEAPVWPRPPAEPRIRWVASVAAPADWGIKKSFFGRLLDALSGDGEAHFTRPTGVAERDGVLYVADPGAQALWILDARRNRFDRIDRLGDTTLVSPVAVALGPGDTVFVADSWRKQIFVVDRRGKLLRAFGREALARPAAVAFDATAGQLYVADSVAHRIRVFSTDGTLLRSLGGNGRRDGEFNFPTHLALDAQGTLLVTDALNFRVQAFSRAGKFLWKLGRAGDGSGDFAAPKGLASDAAGNVYVVDSLFDAVQVFARDGTLLLAFGERGSKAGQFWLPGGIFVGPRGRIYVADAYNQRIQVFRAAAGGGMQSGGTK